jgi:carbonic anhydrase
MSEDLPALRPSRREHLRAGLGLAALAATGPWRALADAAAPPLNPAATEALRRLADGNARYVAGKSMQRDYAAGRAATVQTQYPIAAVLSCADSRAAPEMVFDQGIGDLFVVRVAGNYLSGSALSSLEYAVAVLKTPLIFVLGHSSCGAVKATITEIQQPALLPGHIWDIVDALRPAVKSALVSGGDLDTAIAANVDYNIGRISAAQPVISEAVANGRVKVAGGVYDLASGKVAMRGG